MATKCNRRILGKSVLAVGLLFAASGVASADPFSSNVTNDVYGVGQGGAVNGIPTANDNNDGSPDINDAINLMQGTSFARNVNVDSLFVQPDDVWIETNGQIALIGLTAGFQNTIGVYTDVGVGANQTNLLGPFSGFGFVGDGTAANPFPAAATSLGTGSSFGWFLNANGTQDYFSEPGLNPAGFDHMMTFALPDADGKTFYLDFGAGATAVTLTNPFLLAWEDLAFNGTTLGDDDYDDMMYVVGSVQPVPAPGAAMLGLIGLAMVHRLRRRFG